MEEERYLTPAQAAELLQIGVSTVHRYCTQGILPSTTARAGSPKRLPYTGLVSFLRSKAAERARPDEVFDDPIDGYVSTEQRREMAKALEQDGP